MKQSIISESMTGNLCDCHAKLSVIVPLKNWRKCVADYTWELSVAFFQNKDKRCFSQYVTLAIFTVNTTGPVSHAEKILQTGKVQTRKKLIKTCRGCLELQGFPIRKDSCWTNKKHLDLAHEIMRGFSSGASNQFSKTAARSI